MLFLLMSLAMATWMQAKRRLETSSEPEVTFCEDAPFVAIATPRRVEILDCVSGKVLYRASKADFPALAKVEEKLVTPWYAWPGAHSEEFNDITKWRAPTVISMGTQFTPNLDVNFRQGRFGSRVPAGSGFFPAPPLYEISFSRQGKAVVIQHNDPDREWRRLVVVDLATGKKTPFDNAFEARHVHAKWGDAEDFVFIFGSGGSPEMVVDPAKGAIPITALKDQLEIMESVNQQLREEIAELIRQINRSPDQKMKWNFPIRATAKDGAKVMLSTRSGSEFSVLCKRENTSGEFTNWDDAEVLATWRDEPRIHWLNRTAVVLISRVQGENAMDYQASDTWILDDRPPFLQRATWPFAAGDRFCRDEGSIVGAGATGRLVAAASDSLPLESRKVYWDLCKEKVTPLPNSGFARRYGDFLVMQSESNLHTLDLQTQKLIRRISIERENRPPLVIAWVAWLTIWCWLRPREEGDFSRCLGILTACGFVATVGLSFVSILGARFWVLPVALGLVLIVCIVAAAVRRNASIAAIAICALIVCFFSASSFVCGLESTQNQNGVEMPRISAMREEVFDVSKVSAKAYYESFASLWNAPKVEESPPPVLRILNNTNWK